MVLMCILGGKGTVAGPVIGAILIVVFNEFFVAILGASEINILATGLIMALALMFFPLGIVGTPRQGTAACPASSTGTDPMADFVLYNAPQSTCSSASATSSTPRALAFEEASSTSSPATS